MPVTPSLLIPDATANRPPAITGGWAFLIFLTGTVTALALTGFYPWARIGPGDRYLAPVVCRVAVVLLVTLLWPWLSATRRELIAALLLVATLAVVTELWAGSGLPWDVPVTELGKSLGPWLGAILWCVAGRTAAGKWGANKNLYVLFFALCSGTGTLAYVMGELAGGNASVAGATYGGPWVWAAGAHANDAPLLAVAGGLIIATVAWRNGWKRATTELKPLRKRRNDSK